MRKSRYERPGGDPLSKLTRRRGFVGRIRNYFLAGLLVTAPLAITVWLAWGVVAFVDETVLPMFPARWNPDTYLPFSVPGIGVVLTLAFVTLVGVVAAGYLGRLATGYGERLLARVPVVRSIYSATKQILQTVLAQRSQAFRQVVLVQYPYQGCWSIGFVTAEGRGEIQRVTSDEVVAVFIPAVPNPTTGFLLFVPREEVNTLDISVEQGLKLVISGGIVVPDPDERPSALALAPPPPPRRLGPLAKLRNYFLAGLLVTAPFAITLWLAARVVAFVDARIVSPIPIVWRPGYLLAQAFHGYVAPLLPADWRVAQWVPPEGIGLDIPGLGLLIVFLGLTLIGLLAAGLIGRSLMRATHWALSRVPIVGSVYGALKQILETVMAARSDAFRECVLFQYPRRGVWAIGFITGKTEGHVQELTEGHVINVFLPTTPNPTSGFLMFVPEAEVIHLSMTVEEGLKMVVSGGIVTPTDHAAPAAAPDAPPPLPDRQAASGD
ncbi:MAG: DUF502 domain-containing protein [Tistlia sp.]